MTPSNDEDRKPQIPPAGSLGSFNIHDLESASPLSIEVLTKMANAFMNEYTHAPDLSPYLTADTPQLATALEQSAGDLSAVTDSTGVYLPTGIPSSVPGLGQAPLTDLTSVPGVPARAPGLPGGFPNTPSGLPGVNPGTAAIASGITSGLASPEAYIGAAAVPGLNANPLNAVSLPSSEAAARGSFDSIPSDLRAFDGGQFGFLQEIRPLFAAAEAVVRETDNLSRDLQTPGSYTEAQKSLALLNKTTVPNFGFLQGLVGAVDVVPSLEPLGAEIPAAIDLGLRAAQFDVNSIRRDFPILQERVFGHDLVWFDNAATTQKPQAVIDRLSFFYSHENSNIHRSAHFLAAKSSDAYEASRESVRRFLNARSANEIVFVRGATEAINLVAQSWGRKNLKKDDEVVISWLEHHANIVPWQIVCAETGARLRVAPVNDHGDIIFEEFERILGPRTKLVSITQVSNALGTVTPVPDIVEAAHRHGAKVLIDGAQSVSHMGVNVQEYDCDFFVFSGHKVYAPTGIGVLYGKEEILNSMPPWQGGGNMINDVTFERTVYQAAPTRFEAGTGNIGDAVGLAAALDYVSQIGMHNISAHEEELLEHAESELSRIPGLRILGKPQKRAGVISFVLDGYRTEQVSQYLNQVGIAVRAGHHCAQPILRRFGVESSVRPSFGVYNTCEEVDVLAEALEQLVRARRQY